MQLAHTGLVDGGNLVALECGASTELPDGLENPTQLHWCVMGLSGVCGLSCASHATSFELLLF